MTNWQPGCEGISSSGQKLENNFAIREVTLCIEHMSVANSSASWRICRDGRFGVVRIGGEVQKDQRALR